MTSLCIKLSQFGHKKDRIELELSGKEELSSLYEKVSPELCRDESMKLMGKFTLERITDNYFSISGDYSYQSYLPCSRCNEPVGYELQDSIYHGAARPSSKGDLDEGLYPIKNQELNLEDVIEECLHLAIPNHLICEDCHN